MLRIKTLNDFQLQTNILHQITTVLKAGVITLYTDRMMLSVCHVAYFGFMRCGELTVKNKSDRNVRILNEDISFAIDNSHNCLTLRNSKTDPCQMGVQIYVFDVSPYHPVQSLNEFLQLRKLAECPSNAPLFDDYNSAILTKEAFINMLKHLFSILNLNDSKYCGHSFRIGTATSAATASIE